MYAELQPQCTPEMDPREGGPVNYPFIFEQIIIQIQKYKMPILMFYI